MNDLICTNRPYRIGLTGNIATGKSTVGRMLASWGAMRIDADKIAHQMIAPDGPAYEAVVVEFGADILAPDGNIDRQKLGAIVFSDAAALARLEALVHPPTVAHIQQQIKTSDAPIVVVEAIKLLESGMAETYESIWVTTCPEVVQLRRLVKNRGLSREHARPRIQAQPPQARKLAQAAVIIDTNCALADTRAQVAAAWRDIQRTLTKD